MTNDEVRIGDVEREQAAHRLNAHVGSGRLDLAEFEHRVDAIYAARTRGELATVLADLPEQRGPRPAAATGSTTGRVVAAAWAHWLLTGVICLVIWAATSLGSAELLYFWPMWVIGPWGAMLALGTVTGRAATSCGSPRRIHA